MDSEDDFEDDGFADFSLDDLGAAYARAAAAHDPDTYAAPQGSDDLEEQSSESKGDGETVSETEETEPVHPEGIVEAALFVGHPENESLSAAQLAKLMRDVTEDEVIAMIESLNQSYRECKQAFRIVDDENGFRMTIAPAVEGIRKSFLGKVREARLSQAAVEVLSLVAYQPGSTAQKIQDQRGRESGSLLNQLVRRRLLEIKRKQPAEGGRQVPHYYPTERFLALFHLESLEDLPLVDDGFFGQ